MVEYGLPAAFPRSYYIGAINKRAAEIKAPEETTKGFTRAITDDETGRTLYRASKAASGPEIEDAAPQDEVKPKQFHEFGPAHANIEPLARDSMLRNPSMSMEQSRAAAMNSRRDLADKAAHFASIMGGGAATKTRKADDGDSDISGDVDKRFRFAKRDDADVELCRTERAS